MPEYIRRLLERDLIPSMPKSDVTSIFNLGSSGGSNIARDKDAMIAEAFEASRKNLRG